LKQGIINDFSLKLKFILIVIKFHMNLLN
jgi:hypothetical protein